MDKKNASLSKRSKRFVAVISIVCILLGALVLVQHFQRWLYFQENSCSVAAWMCSYDYDDKVEDSIYNASLKVYHWKVYIVDNGFLFYMFPEYSSDEGPQWWEASWSKERYLPEAINGTTIRLNHTIWPEMYDFQVELKSGRNYYTEGYLNGQEARYDYWDYTRAWFNGTGWDFYLVLRK